MESAERDGLPVLHTLDALAALLERHDGLYLRWSKGPDVDLARSSSKDELTGIPMPGLSANPLDVERWWEDRPLLLWAARRVYDYEHLPREKGPQVRPWVLKGTEAGRGPDNEPLVVDVEPLCWVGDEVIEASRAEVARHREEWGPLKRGR
ncbi:DUF6098 family protein [Streptomyces sp. UH6]|uniref:DUF6098 family protein n=1 Tax=Streptomyces sp. UH6 TaxID=2748379 RepID=UPI0015D504A0|nr:DUF6098 family protein [Streptomyces sp. UH6]NYV74243.1 hypothetical protein [Streptomyces sp. UH6]